MPFRWDWIGMRPDFHLNSTIPSSFCKFARDFNRISGFGETNFGIFTLSNLHNNLFSKSQCQNNYSFYLWLGKTFPYFGHEGISTRFDFFFGSLLTLLFTNFIFFHQNSKKVKFGEFVWFYLQTGPMFSELFASHRILSLDQINFHEIRWLYGVQTMDVLVKTWHRREKSYVNFVNKSIKEESVTLKKRAHEIIGSVHTLRYCTNLNHGLFLCVRPDRNSIERLKSENYIPLDFIGSRLLQPSHRKYHINERV